MNSEIEIMDEENINNTKTIIHNEITKKINLDDLTMFDENMIIKKLYNFNNVEYTIIKYNKSYLKTLEKSLLENDIIKYDILSKYRSVILRNNKLIVFSPEKSLPYEKFKEKHLDYNNIWIEDFVDGTMINVFFDDINNQWEIATRSTIGGNILFFNDIKNYNYFNLNQEDFEKYNNITFRSMFFEACNSCNFNLNTLDNKYVYSFILQHPFNRIVTPIIKPEIFLIKVYEISNTFPNINIIEKPLNFFIENPPYIFSNTTIQFINSYIFIRTFDNLYNLYNNGSIQYDIVGCIVTDINGNRTKIRNINYEKVRKLRGNQPKLQYNYLSLRKDNKLNDFLTYYPEHVLLFRKFQTLLYNYTDELFKNYISCYIKKDKILKDYDFQFKTHMYNLHQKYITELKPINKHIDKKFVINYINNLEPAQQMFVINYRIYQ